MWTQKLKPLLNLECHVVWIARKPSISQIFTVQMPKVFALAHNLEQAPGLSLADTLSLHYAMRNELALSPVDFLLRRYQPLLFMRDSLDSIVEPVLDEMGRFYDWTEEEKQPTVRMLKQLLLKTIWQN